MEETLEDGVSPEEDLSGFPTEPEDQDLFLVEAEDVVRYPRRPPTQTTTQATASKQHNPCQISRIDKESPDSALHNSLRWNPTRRKIKPLCSTLENTNQTQLAYFSNFTRLQTTMDLSTSSLEMQDSLL
ncbi:hypothetical protein G6F37_013352 [Rhizopus arrhizus]|nr:hypothetical protein G6F38_013765 [Rhizopus arrhizus]KAG1138320.1 hypothetical protein G6F37_013352 [Rhizopus arrhizus]